MDLDIEQLADEVMQALAAIDLNVEGEHLYSNYQNIVAWSLRLTELQTMISLEELRGGATPEMKKFRTAVLVPVIERLDKVSAFESRKITAKVAEIQMNR